MAYSAWSVVFGEQPSAAKWNILGTNDAYFDALIGSGTAWASWSPSYANVTVGNGTVTAKYQQLGKNVFFRWSIVCGSTTALGTGITISVPVTAHADYNKNLVSAGTASVFDDGGQQYLGEVVFNGSVTVVTPFWNDGSADLAATFPITEDAADEMHIKGFYEAA